MTDKRYQVFISSTYEDLKEERRAVQDTLINMGDFPVQMESFPASDEEQLDYIRPLIEACDYYILIIGGRYGSLTDDGKSYTEKEFQHAVEKGVPVIVLPHSNPTELPSNKTENTKNGWEKLEKFTKVASTGRIRKTQETSTELQLRVTEAITHAKKTKKRPGWVKGDTVASLSALKEMENLRKENKKLEVFKQPAFEISNLPKLPALTETVEIEIEMLSGGGYGISNEKVKISGTWLSFFIAFHRSADISYNDWNDEEYFVLDEETTRQKMGQLLASICEDVASNGHQVTSVSFNLLQSYFIEVGLLYDEGDVPFPDLAKKIIRRLTVAGLDTSSIKVVEGNILIDKRMDDDEIPF